MTYKVQIDNVIRDATPEEAALIEQRHAEAQAQAQAVANKAAAAASGRAKLKALGFSDEEIAALGA